MRDDLPLSATVQEQIIQYIIENDLKPGDRLETEQNLAQMLNVGRGTVREAVRGLVSRNILVVRQGAGTFVSPEQGVSKDPLGLTFRRHDRKLALDLLDVRLILEPEIAQMAAANATEQEIQKIDSQCSRVERYIEEGKSYREADVEFHRRVAAASHNQVFITLIPVIHSSATLNIDLTRNELKQNTIRWHRDLTECIRRHDTCGARYAMLLHLAENRQFLLPGSKTDSTEQKA